MIIVKVSSESEAGVMPDEKDITPGSAIEHHARIGPAREEEVESVAEDLARDALVAAPNGSRLAHGLLERAGHPAHAPRVHRS